MDQACREVQVQGDVNFRGHNRVDAVWSGSDRRDTFRDSSCRRRQV